MYDSPMQHTKKTTCNMNIIEDSIKNALLREVYVTPKPGLVDLNDCGAHTDMDVHTFECSAEAITPFLLGMYNAGFSFPERNNVASISGEGNCDSLGNAERESLSELFLRVREIGKEAERAMFTATKKVNTHKGIIFSMGLLLTAIGIDAGSKSSEHGNAPAPDCEPERTSAPTSACEPAKECLPYEERICFLAGSIADATLREELDAMRLANAAGADNNSHGERVFATYGIDGVRGEAIAGFPCLREVALPRYRSTKDSSLTENDRALDTLLAIMSKLSDTNLISRGGPDALNFVKSRATDIISSHTPGSTSWRHEIELFNAECIEKHISPGGAADILALTFLLTSFAE